MTAQVPEILLHRGEQLRLLQEPFASWLEQAGIKLPSSSTSCRRGYVGTWSIRDGELYLDNVQSIAELVHQAVREGGEDPRLADVAAFTSSGVSEPRLGLRRFFPDSQGPVKASWVNGRLRCAQGELLHYRHAGFASTWVQERYFWVRNGVVVSERVRDNEALGLPLTSRAEQAPTTIPPQVLDEYRNTTYFTTVDGGELALRIGEPSKALDRLIGWHRPSWFTRTKWRARELFDGHHTEKWCAGAAIITAWNTYGEECCAEENAAANDRLAARLRKDVLSVYPAIGRSDDSPWPAEASFLVVGLSEESASDLGRSFEQNAIAYALWRQAPRLLLLR